MNVNIIAAVARNGAIGRRGEMPWHYSEDFEHFKRTTLGHAVIMGRRTWESLPKRPLPNRRNVIVSQSLVGNEPRTSDPVAVVHDLSSALDFCGYHREAEAFVIGGARLFDEAAHVADRIYLTKVDIDVPDADTFWHPPQDGWREAERRRGETPELQFVTLERSR
jgi:dihydrofolate reductase